MTIGLDTTFSNLKNFTVVDNNGIEIGRPIDIVFDLKTDILTKLIIGGSFIEELKERIGLKPDDDPVISINTIESIEDTTIRLNIAKEGLANKLEKEIFSSEETIFSEVKNFTVEAEDGEKLGRFIDAVIHIDNTLSFIIGDSIFREFLEKVGLTPDFDLLVPCTQIKEINPKTKKISLTVNKNILLKTLDGLPIQDGLDRLNISTLAGKEADYMRFKISN